MHLPPQSAALALHGPADRRWAAPPGVGLRPGGGNDTCNSPKVWCYCAQTDTYVCCTAAQNCQPGPGTPCACV
jgi:hypothetical protein